MTKIIFPPLVFNKKFKTKKEARQTAIKAMLAYLNDAQVLSEIEVKVLSRSSKEKRKK
jgi:hypothetical protein